jgi:hypothetical protein
MLLDNLVLDEREHCITTTKAEKSDLQIGEK